MHNVYILQEYVRYLYKEIICLGWPLRIFSIVGFKKLVSYVITNNLNDWRTEGYQVKIQFTCSVTMNNTSVVSAAAS